MSSFQSSGFHLKIHALHFVRTHWKFFAHFCLFLLLFQVSSKHVSCEISHMPRTPEHHMGSAGREPPRSGLSTAPWCRAFPKAQAGGGLLYCYLGTKVNLFGKFQKNLVIRFAILENYGGMTLGKQRKGLHNVTQKVPTLS